jgi:hypothetical protein
MRGIVRVLAGAILLLAMSPLPAAAATSPADFFDECPTYPSPDGPMQICSGQAPSFDGTPLDFDLTKPLAGSGPGPHPLIVMLHGLGNSKREWESLTDEGDGADKWHWNSHWFAKHGYYVLTYTARGHRDEPPQRPEHPPTPGAGSLSEPNGTAHLKSRPMEIRDTQWLASLAATAFPDIDPSRVAVSGGSYGGGETWVLASQPEWTFPRLCAARETPDCATMPTVPELDRPLKDLALQVAVPKYAWTDLGYSAVPNGHGGGSALADIYESSTGRAEDPDGKGNPVGVAKESYLDGFFGTAPENLIFAHGTTLTPSEEQPPPNIPQWFGRLVTQGDPYDLAGMDDPNTIPLARRGTTEYRSSYYQDLQWKQQLAGREVAIFAIQGWTDDLFPAVESFRQYKYLKRLDPMWPVSVAVADVGHDRGQNKPETWRRLNAQAWQMVQAQIPGSHRQRTTVYSEPTVCADDGDPDNRLPAAQQLTATSPEGLSNGALMVRYPPGETRAPKRGAGPPGGDPDNATTEPVFGSLIQPGDDCRSSGAAVFQNRYTGRSVPLLESSTYVGLGFVEVPYTLALNEQFPSDPVPVTATLNARVWDVAPGGPSLLMTRGTYRITLGYDNVSGTLRLPLFGNHWSLAPGHRVRLDLTQVDQPTFLASNQSSKLVFEDPARPTATPTLHLPTRESGTRVVASD